MLSTNSRRGSVLITTLIFAAIIAISLTSYLKLSLAAPRLADRSFYSNAAQNLADTGFEQTLWSLNNSSNWTTSGGFTARSGFANQYQGTFPSSSTYYTLSRGVKGQVKVWADVSTANPHVISKATITLGDGTTVSKTVEGYLSPRVSAATPMVARETITFVGNVSLDSWDSKSDTVSTADDVRYSLAVRNTEAGIASTSISTGSVSLQNADVYGRAAIGTSTSAGISVGSGGRLAGSFAAGTGIDFSRVTYDFTTSFPDNIAPSGGTALGVVNNNLTINPGVATVTTYSASSISLSGNKTLTIGPAVVDATHPAVSVRIAVVGGITVGGSSEIVINPGSKLELYSPDDIDIGGNGVTNGGATLAMANNPANFKIFGTRSAASAASLGVMQQVNVKGTSYLSAVVNVPNGDVFINGTADTYGSILGNKVRMVGTGNFHADESLARSTTTGLWGMTKWRELATPTERNLYSAQLSF